MKKNIVFIFIATLILNLLPQTSNAWRLDENNTKLIYNDADEKEDWEKYQLPHAIYSKLVSRKTTVLDIAIMAEKEAQANPAKETIVHRIQDNKTHERRKMIVKWEKDNEYISEELENNWKITPSLRCTLLKEIREEERLAKEKEQTWWKRIKSDLKIVSFGIAFVGAMFVNKNVEEKTRLEIALKWAAGTMLTVLTTIEVVEAGEGWVWNKIKGRLRKGKEDEEIKIPPLQNMPVLPKNYERVDVYSYGL